MSASASFEPEDGVEFVASAEAAVVFASLVDRCGPPLCDRCTVDLDDGGTTYRVSSPPVGPEFGDGRDGRTLRHQFVDPVAGEYRGVVTFTWHTRAPTAEERSLTRVLVTLATQTVTLMRAEIGAREAVKKSESLLVALENSRNIGTAVGILMSHYRLSRERAFELLSEASQQANRKLREVALDVIDTGWLDPALFGRRRGLASSHPADHVRHKPVRRRDPGIR